MKKWTAAAAAGVAVLAMAALSGVALAGDHQGDHGDHAQTQTSDSAQPGQKPDSTTQHDTSCTTGGGDDSAATCSSTDSSKADASKRYGNGKTAAQIANDHGAPSGTTITGPGNSQPHKICGRDVHAFKGGDCSSKHSSPQPPQTTAVAPRGEQPEQENEHAHVKVFICHATGSATNPFVLIRVSVNAEWAHTHHHDGRDVVLGVNPGPCPTGGTQGTTTMQTTTTVPTTPTTTTVATTTAAATTTTTVTTTAAATTTTTAATTTTTTTAAAAAANTPSAASGVLGATKALKAPTASTPASAPAGVLGTLETLGKSGTSGTLPFTGLRLWIVELIALGLIGAGVATRLIARRRTEGGA